LQLQFGQLAVRSVKAGYTVEGRIQLLDEFLRASSHNLISSGHQRQPCEVVSYDVKLGIVNAVQRERIDPV